MFYFPTPYPDEVVGSLLTRGCLHTGLPIKGLAWLLYAKRRSYNSFLLASSIRPLARLTGLDPEELLWAHTVFPYVVAFMPRAEVMRLQAMVMSPAETHAGCIASCTQSVTQGVAFRRYCSACVAADEREFGESYWHRAHQLPATYVCHIHGAPLLETALRIRGAMRRWQYALPSTVPGRPVRPRLPQPLALALARKSHQLLRQDSRLEADWCARYRKMAFGAGYARTTDAIAGRRLAEDLERFYGSNLLGDTGSALAAHGRPWPGLMVRPGETGPFAPIKHILLRTFLERHRVDSSALNYGAPGPKPRNRQALDRDFARRLRATLRRIKLTRRRVTIKELLTRSSCWGAYRHEPSSFPMTRALLREFRASAWSARRMPPEGARQR